MLPDIHVQRFKDDKYLDGSIEPEDRSWLLHLVKGGPPEFMVRVKYEADDGTIEHGYLAVTELQGMTIEEAQSSLFLRDTDPTAPLPPGGEVSEG